MSNEYERVFDEIFGFEFPYNRRIGKSKTMTWYRVKMIPECKRNANDIPMFVKCTKCDKYMNFVDGWYVCELCGSRVKERTLYSQLDRENQEFDKQMDSDYEEYWE